MISSACFGPRWFYSHSDFPHTFWLHWFCTFIRRGEDGADESSRIYVASMWPLPITVIALSMLNTAVYVRIAALLKTDFEWRRVNMRSSNRGLFAFWTFLRLDGEVRKEPVSPYHIPLAPSLLRLVAASSRASRVVGLTPSCPFLALMIKTNKILPMPHASESECQILHRLA